ncbi:MBL fold metallo-hydrolase [Bacillus sp. SL00103]
MLDVGQGDSLFIQPLTERDIYLWTWVADYLLMNHGKRRKASAIGDQTLILFMHSKGIKKLDVLFLTHADQDHMGEAVRLIKRNKSEAAGHTKRFARSPEDAKLLKEATEKGS